MKLFAIRLAMIAFVFAIACKKESSIDPVDEPIKEEEEEEEDIRIENFAASSYSDNYTSIASWTTRSSWNLGNMHDPTDKKCGDYYYYMYRTDASYGNSHEGHGHFPYRRSKDLVDWDFMGMALTAVPDWVKESLNNKQAGMEPPLPTF